MAMNNTVTLVGNVTRDPELRYTPNGAAVAKFGLAWNRRYQRNGQQVEEVNYFDITCWGSLADNVASSVTKGSRVVVFGELDHQTWDTPDGQKRSRVEIKADDVAPSLRWASAEIHRNPRDDNFGGGAPMGGAPQQSAPANAGGAPQHSYPDEEPF